MRLAIDDTAQHVNDYFKKSVILKSKYDEGSSMCRVVFLFGVLSIEQKLVLWNKDIELKIVLWNGNKKVQTAIAIVLMLKR